MTTNTTATVAAGETRVPARTRARTVVIGADWPLLRALGPLLAVVSAAVLTTGIDEARAPGLLLFLVGLGMASLGRERNT